MSASLNLADPWINVPEDCCVFRRVENVGRETLEPRVASLEGCAYYAVRGIDRWSGWVTGLRC
jgi:hypothetical protein